MLTNFYLIKTLLALLSINTVILDGFQIRPDPDLTLFMKLDPDPTETL